MWTKLLLEAARCNLMFLPEAAGGGQNSIAFGKAPRRGERGQNMLYIGYLIILDGQSMKKIRFGNFHF